jgi:hypothetical protein
VNRKWTEIGQNRGHNSGQKMDRKWTESGQKVDRKWTESGQNSGQKVDRIVDKIHFKSSVASLKRLLFYF